MTWETSNFLIVSQVRGEDSRMLSGRQVVAARWGRGQGIQERGEGGMARVRDGASGVREIWDIISYSYVRVCRAVTEACWGLGSVFKGMQVDWCKLRGAGEVCVVRYTYLSDLQPSLLVLPLTFWESWQERLQMATMWSWVRTTVGATWISGRISFQSEGALTEKFCFLYFDRWHCIIRTWSAPTLSPHLAKWTMEDREFLK